MADENDGATSDVSSGSSAEYVSDSETELMVATRERRQTAGNRYSATVGQAQEEAAEEEDDDVALLFAEAEEGDDEEYNSYEGDDDADMSSSDDNDDQGPNAAADDFEGEREIQKQAKTERQKKRKADFALTTMASIRKKKPKIDPTSLHRAPDRPKPSKRKERVSWLPNQEAAPGRTSLRKQTIEHRAITHARMKENEKHRLKMKAIRERKEKERAAEAPKELTQEDRLAEAERVERRNAKSLNRWEAMERKRAEEQAAKLAALKDRKLDGAVITWYSAGHKYTGHKPEKTSIEELAQFGLYEPKKRGRKPKALLEQLAAAKQAQADRLSQAVASTEPNMTTETMQPAVVAASQVQSSVAGPATLEEQSAHVSYPGLDDKIIEASSTAEISESKQEADAAASTHAPESPSQRPKVEQDLEQETTQQVVKDSSEPQIQEQKQQESQDQTQDPVLQLPEQEVASHEQTPSRPEPESITPSEAAEVPAMGGFTDTSATKIDGDQTTLEEQPENQEKNHVDNHDNIPLKTEQSVPQQLSIVEQAAPLVTTEVQGHLAQQPPSVNTNTPATPSEFSEVVPSPAPLVEVISTRNVIVLEKFDQLTSDSRHEYSAFYGSRKSGKPTKHSTDLCPVTGWPAKYRDPSTGIGYANAVAYKKLKELREHQFTWSGMLGCYVGREGVAARGVPDGFSG